MTIKLKVENLREVMGAILNDWKDNGDKAAMEISELEHMYRDICKIEEDIKKYVA